MQCHLNGVNVSETLIFLVDSPSVTSCAIQVIDPFGIAHTLIFELQLSSATNYFDMCSLSITEYENKEKPKVYLIVEKPPWDPSNKEFQNIKLVC